MKDDRNYSYHFTHDPVYGTALPHAVSKVEDTSGNTLYAYEYDLNGHMTKVKGPGIITIRAGKTSETDPHQRMELWICDTNTDKKEMKTSWEITETDYRDYSWEGWWDESAMLCIVFGDEAGISILQTDINGTPLSIADDPVQCIDTSQTEIEGNSITRTTVTEAWDAGAGSIKSFKGNGGIEFTALRNDTFVICGLSHANTDPGLDSIDYGIVFTIGATIGIYENGTEVTPPGLKGNIRYNAGVRFGVLRRGNTIVYQRNGETIYESETPGDPSLELFFDCSLYSYEAAIGDIQWVPVDDVSFTDIINVTIDSINNTITRTPQTDAWDAGAASVNSFKGNGGVEFSVPQDDAFVICGLSHANTDAGYTAIDYGILLTIGATAAIYENGVDVTPPELTGNIRYNTGVRFSVLRRGSSILYQRDGVTLYESQAAVDPSTALFFDCSLYSSGAGINNVKWIESDTVSFTDTVNADIDNLSGTITRTPQTDAWDAGAASINCFKGNGGIEFTVPQTGAFVICGLSHADADAGYRSIDYGILCTIGATIGIYEKGVNVTPPGLDGTIRYNTEVRFSIVRKGNTILYQRNGETFYTSQCLINPDVPLMVDCSLYSAGASISNVRWLAVSAVSFTDVENASITPWSYNKQSFQIQGTSSSTREIFYDEENRMIEINDNGRITTFAYGADNRRIKKTESGKTTYYFFPQYEMTMEGEAVIETNYYFAGGQCIAQRRSTGTESELHYIHTDHLGSAIKITDREGSMIQHYGYTPFGEIVTVNGDYNASYLYTGQEFDKGTGLYYYGARYYDPVLGRFIQADSVLDGLNRYTYCGNNPVIYVDPDGNFIFPFWHFDGNGGTIGLNFLGLFGVGVNWAWDGSYVGGCAELGPHIGDNWVNCTARADFNYYFETGQTIGTFSGNLGISGMGYNASVSWNLSSGDYLGASIGAGFSLFGFTLGGSIFFNALGQLSGWNTSINWGGISIGYGSNGFSWGIDGRADTLIINGPGGNDKAGAIEESFLNFFNFLPWVVKANTPEELTEILNSLPRGYRNVVITGTHGFYLPKLGICDINGKNAIRPDELGEINLANNVHIWIETCNQGFVGEWTNEAKTKSEYLDNIGAWRTAFGTMNVHGYPGLAYGSTFIRTAFATFGFQAGPRYGLENLVDFITAWYYDKYIHH